VVNERISPTFHPTSGAGGAQTLRPWGTAHESLARSARKGRVTVRVLQGHLMLRSSLGGPTFLHRDAVGAWGLTPWREISLGHHRHCMPSYDERPRWGQDHDCHL